MPEFYHEKCHEYWAKHSDPMVYKALCFMESVEDWAIDENEEFDAVFVSLGESLINIDNIDLKHADKSPTIPDSQLESEYLQFKEILDDEIRKSELSEREKLVVNGHDLMRELDIPAGKELGDIIRKCKDLILEEPEKNNKSDLISYAKEIKG